MQTGKEVIYDYCKEMSNIDIIHIEDCIYNKEAIENNELDRLCGCPTSYGLENFTGDCETNNSNSTNLTAKECRESCDRCWDRALNGNY